MKNTSHTYLPYGKHNITDDDVNAVLHVLRNDYLTQGEHVPRFEQAVCRQVDAKYGVAVNSATSALHIACLALGLGPNDYLWTTPNTFVASANCGRYCGSKVDFVDIDNSTGLMCMRSLEAKLKSAEASATLPKIVIPVHLCGTSCDMEFMHYLSKRYGFAVLEDASHAIGGRFQANPVGSCVYSSITVFSFHPVKIITTGEGGMAVTNNPHLAQMMAELRSHGITKISQNFEFPPQGPWTYEQQNLGFNYRMTDLQAALGISQMEKLDSIVNERNKLMKNYRALVSGLPLRFLEVPQGVVSSFHLAVIRLDDPSSAHHLRIFEGLRAAGIGVQLHYTPVHLQPYYRRLGFREGDFPEAEAYASNAISLPLYPGLQEGDQQRVVRTLASLLAG